MDKLSEAICFATKAFDGKRRKGDNLSTIFHSLEAAYIVQAVFDDEDVVCAAVLHDTVEDAGIRIEEIEARFGKRVADLVSSETENKDLGKDLSETWQRRKEETLMMLKNSTDLGVRALWLGDKLSNMRSFYFLYNRLGEKMWDMFHQKNPEAHYAYYKTIAEELAVFSGTDAYTEYTALINKVFGR